jgi:hypothetical protein
MYVWCEGLSKKYQKIIQFHKQPKMDFCLRFCYMSIPINNKIVLSKFKWNEDCNFCNIKPL